MTGLTTAEVLALLAKLGRPIKRSTWTGEVSHGRAPQSRHIGRTPLWDPAEIEAYGRYEWRPSTDQDPMTTREDM